MFNALQFLQEQEFRNRQLAGVEADRARQNKLMEFNMQRQAQQDALARQQFEQSVRSGAQRNMLMQQGMQSRERIARERANQPRWDSERGVWVTPPTAGPGGVVPGAAGVFAPPGLASNRGKAPSGFRWNDKGNLEAIPGGPADMKQEGAFNQDMATLRQGESSYDRLGGAAEQLLKHEGLKGITGIRSVIPNIPGSAAADAAAKLQTLKAQIGFSVLQEMRNASKTGGALGSVTERELGFLQNALDALDNAQSLEQFTESLSAIKKWSQEGKGRLQEAFNVKHRNRKGADGQPAAGPTMENDPLGLRKK